MTIEEDVDAFTDRVWECDNTINGWLTVKNADVVGEVVQDGQIVLDHDDVVVIPQKRANDLSSAESLLDIKVGTGLVKHVDIGLLNANCANGKTLKLSTGKLGDFTFQQVVQLQSLGDLIGVAKGSPAVDEMTDRLVGAPDSLGDLIHILRLNDGFEIVFEQLREVVCKLLARSIHVYGEGWEELAAKPFGTYFATRIHGSAL